MGGVEVCEAERGWAKKRSSETTSIACSYEFCWEMLVVGKESGINIRNSLLLSTSYYVIRRHLFFFPSRLSFRLHCPSPLPVAKDNR